IAIVLDERADAVDAALPRPKEAPVLPHPCEHQVRGALRQGKPLGTAEHTRGKRQAPNHQSVPTSEDLLVPPRFNPLLPRLEQKLARSGQVRGHLLLARAETPRQIGYFL